jgi:hypothetical protein
MGELLWAGWVDGPPARWRSVSMSEIPSGAQFSDDGQFWWDGSDWQPVPSTEGGEIQAAVDDTTAWPHDATVADSGYQDAGYAVADPAAIDAGAAVSTNHDDLDDGTLALGIFRYEALILSHWKYALDSFDKVLVSESQKAAHPDFAQAVLKVFEEKVLGEFVAKSHAGFVFGALGAVVNEAERAKAAQTSVALRDFYVSHVTAIANLETSLAVQQDTFIQQVKATLEHLLATDLNSYGMLRMDIMALHQDVENRLMSSTQETLFELLSTEWIDQSPASDLKIRIWEDDLSVWGWKVDAPKGDQIADRLAQHGGADVWHMRVPKYIACYERGGNGWPLTVVRLDADNTLVNLPGEQDARYKQVYARLQSKGSLRLSTAADH